MSHISWKNKHFPKFHIFSWYFDTKFAGFQELHVSKILKVNGADAQLVCQKIFLVGKCCKSAFASVSDEVSRIEYSWHHRTGPRRLLLNSLNSISWKWLLLFFGKRRKIGHPSIRDQQKGLSKTHGKAAALVPHKKFRDKKHLLSET